MKLYIPLSEKDDNIFESSTFSRQRKTELIKKSWARIFDLDWHEPYINHPKNERMIQAVFWELRLENVLEVEHFTAF